MSKAYTSAQSLDLSGLYNLVKSFEAIRRLFVVFLLFKGLLFQDFGSIYYSMHNFIVIVEM